MRLTLLEMTLEDVLGGMLRRMNGEGDIYTSPGPAVAGNSGQ